MVAAGKYCTSVYRAYSLFYVVGTCGAVCIPVVGWTPLKSMECLGAFAVFLIYQLLELCDIYRRRQKVPMSAWRFFWFRGGVFVFALLALCGLILMLLPTGYFGPLSSRIRGLFVKHTRTGNPLVDSVAEHQPADEDTYEVYLERALYPGLVGLMFCCIGFFTGSERCAAQLFLMLYAIVAHHFSVKMVRLIIICGNICSACAGIGIGQVADWCFAQFLDVLHRHSKKQEHPAEEIRTGGVGSILREIGRVSMFSTAVSNAAEFKTNFAVKQPGMNQFVRLAVASVLVFLGFYIGPSHWEVFQEYCQQTADSFSSPQIMYETDDGRIIDDYFQGYLWLRDNTPKDARVMAWWDYGYQITGIANRTSIADGNTWNHEHIATLGRALVNHEKKAWNIIRHLADYVLVWAGDSGSDDIGKSPHLARIANSIFDDVCPGDPYCDLFDIEEIEEDGTMIPTKMMGESLLFRMCLHHRQPGVRVNPKLFEEVYTSENDLIRIFKVLNVSKESKEWVADPRNRICDAPGSWYCTGQYPPALDKLIAKRKNFAQLEDFNRKNEEKSEYSKRVEEELYGSGPEL
eukprot:gnl/MRDRNA2_/MRDRNA2_180875_c0_seq1.p1 gnl/MRDRNA2_/MRDRNA2_180875_c0~~gnl/MRDRNA2_/MRDRNA2_180875_c0_seq1.p1  ORF type:complete len:642 (-),score=84.87 gnl/MRDRNA2_/MRDRNA2_180875_c0_seq1:42-1766(-)